MQHYQMLIGGEWVDAADGQVFETMNPYLGKPWATIPRAGAEDAARAVAAAKAAFRDGPWSRMNPTGRGALIRRLADLIAERAEDLARVEVTDNGKLIAEMHGQLRYVPQFYQYFAGLADKLQGAVLPIDKPAMFNYTRREPLGVCVAITAWNSPLLLAAWKLAPGLAAGNTFVLKPSEHASASSLEFAKLFDEAGFPPGVVNVVTGFGPEIGEALVSHPDVAKVAFTGSERTGRRIYETAARGLKKVTLELGGKSPNIVFDDAELENAANGVVAGIFAAAGQTCIAGSRVLVQDTIYEDFLDRLVAIAQGVRMGDPQEWTTQLGPISNAAPVPQGPRLPRGRQGRRGALCGRRRGRPRARSAVMAHSSSRRSSPTSTIACGSRARRCSGRFCRRSASRTSMRRSRSPTTRLTASPPGSGPRTCAAR